MISKSIALGHVLQIFIVPGFMPFLSHGCAHVQEQDIAARNCVTPKGISKINKLT